MLLLDERVHVTGVDAVQEVNIVVRVELRHLALRRRFGALYVQHKANKKSNCAPICLCEKLAHEDLHFLVQPVVHDERVAHADPRWLHPVCQNKIHLSHRLCRARHLRMSRAIVEAADIRVEEVALGECIHTHVQVHELTYRKPRHKNWKRAYDASLVGVALNWRVIIRHRGGWAERSARVETGW